VRKICTSPVNPPQTGQRSRHAFYGTGAGLLGTRTTRHTSPAPTARSKGLRRGLHKRCTTLAVARRSTALPENARDLPSAESGIAACFIEAYFHTSGDALGADWERSVALHSESVRAFRLPMTVSRAGICPLLGDSRASCHDAESLSVAYGV
jgi:hypothetical protein